MTSKEALRDLRTYFDYHKDEQFKTIEKDLEVLEIFKKHIREDFSYSMLMIDNDELSKEEIKKIGKWLENEKN